MGGGVGDTFLASVVARALKTRYAEVDMLAAPAHRSILRGNPDISMILEDASAAALRTRAYDASVCTWATFENAMVPVTARIPVRVGQARRLYSILFTKRVSVRSELGDRTTHWTQIMLDYARAVGCDTNDAQPRINVNAEDRAESQQLLDRARITGQFAILHPTRGIARPDRWPLQPFVRLINALVERYEMPLLVSGSRQDRPLIERMFAEARTEPRSFTQRNAAAINISGTTSLRGFTALAERAQFVVAMDSGPMHLAASTGTPTAGIFALRSDEPERWAPLGANTVVVRGLYACPPAHRKETCPDFACVSALDITSLFASLDGILRPDKG
ncbi:MAG: glycosyltransferase family 9 protein [Vulcanimicrobiaceae bacterium]